VDNGFEILTVDAGNVDRLGFFCYMSKPKAPGYRQKRAWLAARFAEGLSIKMLHETGGRTVGFIETIPGEYAWRAVDAPGYLVIHCLWVVGQGKGKGHGTRLLQTSLDEARRQWLRGVVMVASDGVWLAGKQLFLKNGFEQVDVCACAGVASAGAKAPPAFRLLVHSFGDPDSASGTFRAPNPAFPTDWAARQASFGDGFTVIRTPQCPYIDDATADLLQIAAERGIPARAVELTSAQEAQSLSPSPYGTFGIVRDGRLFSYHYLCRKELEKLLAE
jgi:GNAT superfamily N-acetyltransferase